MDVPSTRDRVVKVSAYLTNETFGYTHWRAAQFCAPAADRPSVLVICTSIADRERVLAALDAVLATLTPD